MIVKMTSSICAVILLFGSRENRFEKFPQVASFEVTSGLIAMPRYSGTHDLCEISIEKRHYYNGTVDFDALMSKSQVLSAFDLLVSKEERGRAGGKTPGDVEITETDGGMRTQRIPYANVTLALYGRSDNARYLSAIISWNKRQCEA